MVEHLLESRLESSSSTNDPAFDDFLLTHVLFISIRSLVTELRKQYPFALEALLSNNQSMASTRVRFPQPPRRQPQYSLELLMSSEGRGGVLQVGLNQLDRNLGNFK